MMQCLNQSWYISCDWQLFVLGTPLVLLLQKSPRTGVVASGLVSVASVFVVFFTTYNNNLAPFIHFSNKE